MVAELPHSFPINSIIDYWFSDDSKWYFKIKVDFYDELWLPDICAIACPFLFLSLQRISSCYKFFSFFLTHSFAGEMSHYYSIFVSILVRLL